jgi:acetylornithine deacetylase/succinyl-diaminopimelate desuccinylase-like protein
MTAAITAEDPGARLLPYMPFAGTDAKPFGRLGIRHFGSTPLQLPPELDFTALFHGVDERVPVESLEFGMRVLCRLLVLQQRNVMLSGNAAVRRHGRAYLLWLLSH